jgi:hypothetical protein
MVVYFVKCDDMIKIGSAKNFYNRMASLKKSAGGKIELLLVIEGDVKEERKHQKALKEYQVNGDWFFKAPDVLQYIERLKHLSIMDSLQPASYVTVRIKMPAKAVVTSNNPAYHLDEDGIARLIRKIPKIEASESSAIVYMDEEITRLRARVKELETEVWMYKPKELQK